MNPFKTLATPVLVALLATPVAAYETGDIPTGKDPGTADARAFERMDQDGDGYLSESEVAQAGQPALARAFDRFDANGDGFLSKVEYDRR